MARHAWILAVLSAVTAGCGGVNSNDVYLDEARKNQGLVIILPGIEGESQYNHDIREGLLSAGEGGALPIYHWGWPIPGVGMLLNQMDFVGNRIEASKIATMIVQYQDSYPGRPVYLVGHSGGGGIAVFAAEALPEGRQVDGLVLLSSSIWYAYDLTRALGHTKNGIVNFYNKDDAGLLGVGTTLTSNVDGMRGPSAGLVGFSEPGGDDPQIKQQLYGKLYQVELDESMKFGGGSHDAVTQPGFVSMYVAPWVSARAWPAGSHLTARP